MKLCYLKKITNIFQVTINTVYLYCNTTNSKEISRRLFILAVPDPGWPSVARSPWRHWCTACSASPEAQYMAGMLTTIVYLRAVPGKRASGGWN